MYSSTVNHFLMEKHLNAEVKVDDLGFINDSTEMQRLHMLLISIVSTQHNRMQWPILKQLIWTYPKINIFLQTASLTKLVFLLFWGMIGAESLSGKLEVLSLAQQF